MKEIKAYECPFCLKVFRSKRHNCKFNPDFKNCFTCKNNKGFDEDNDDIPYGRTVYPKCEQSDANILQMSRLKWNLDCTCWERIDNYKNKKSFIEHIYNIAIKNLPM